MENIRRKLGIERASTHHTYASKINMLTQEGEWRHVSHKRRRQEAPIWKHQQTNESNKNKRVDKHIKGYGGHQERSEQ